MLYQVLLAFTGIIVSDSELYTVKKDLNLDEKSTTFLSKRKKSYIAIRFKVQNHSKDNFLLLFLSF